MSTLRIERVRELLKREIGEIVRREFPLSEAGMITVNDVDITNDLQYATVFVGIIGTPEQKKKGVDLLQKEKKRIQGMVGRSVVLKYTPQLKFVADEAVARGDRVLRIMDEIEQSSAPNEGSSEDHR